MWRGRPRLQVERPRASNGTRSRIAVSERRRLLLSTHTEHAKPPLFSRVLQEKEPLQQQPREDRLTRAADRNRRRYFSSNKNILAASVCE